MFLSFCLYRRWFAFPRLRKYAKLMLQCFFHNKLLSPKVALEYYMMLLCVCVCLVYAVFSYLFSVDGTFAWLEIPSASTINSLKQQQQQHTWVTAIVMQLAGSEISDVTVFTPRSKRNLLKFAVSHSICTRSCAVSSPSSFLLYPTNFGDASQQP